jgi:hypothetical protein
MATTFDKMLRDEFREIPKAPEERHIYRKTLLSTKPQRGDTWEIYAAPLGLKS